MKRSVAILVLGLFLTHLIGFYVYFVVRQGQIRQEMREAIGSLPSEDFETFVFTVEEYQRVRVNDHEIKINGRMYDHSTPKFENGTVTLFARHDEAEDNLISFLKEVVKGATHDKKPAPAQLSQFYSLSFILQSPLQMVPVFSSERMLYSATAMWPGPIPPVESPPPKV